MVIYRPFHYIHGYLLFSFPSSLRRDYFLYNLKYSIVSPS